MASQTPPVPPQGVWPREQRRKPADSSESYWLPIFPGWDVRQTGGTVAVMRGDRLTKHHSCRQTLPDKRIGFVGEFSYVPSPLLV